MGTISPRKVCHNFTRVTGMMAATKTKGGDHRDAVERGVTAPLVHVAVIRDTIRLSVAARLGTDDGRIEKPVRLMAHSEVQMRLKSDLRYAARVTTPKGAPHA